MIATLNHAKKIAFLEAFAECASIRGASRASGVSHRSHYNWLRDDPEYVEAFEEAKERAIHFLEDVAVQRASQGVRRIKFNSKTGEPYVDPHTGEPYVEHTYSDLLLIFLLKALLPHKYRENTFAPDGANATPTMRIPADDAVKSIDSSVPKEPERNGDTQS